MDSQVTVALALSLVGGLSNTIGELVPFVLVMAAFRYFFLHTLSCRTKMNWFEQLWVLYMSLQLLNQ